MILIGLAGKKGSGKNTLASLINKLAQPIPTYELAFADPLKDEVCQALGITRGYLDLHKANFRLILQGWGTDYKRALIDDAYWIKKFMGNLSKISNEDNPIVIVTDVRFLNEYEIIKNLGGYVIRVSKGLNTRDEDSHSSETNLDGIRLPTIYNTGTLEQLEQGVIKLLKEMKILK